MMTLGVKKLVVALSLLVTIFSPALPVCAQTSPNNDQVLIDRARGIYYNLGKHGFAGFTSTIEPNWETILGPVANPENLKLFRAIRFTMIVDSKGGVTVSHEIANEEKKQLAPHILQIHYHLQRLIAGFFGTWSIFMISSPFPENGSRFKTENIGSEYHLTYKMQSSDAVLKMGMDLVTAELILTGPRAKRTIKPVFEKTSEGVTLTAYQTVFEPISEGVKTTLDFNIEYQDVGGLKLPLTVQIKGMHGNEPVEAELRFVQAQLFPRQSR